MQFHLNGFRPGDPDVYEPTADHVNNTSAEGLPEKLDVLIVGCGPAGLTLAAQMAAFPSIRTGIFDQNAGPLQRGRADGIACRTMEMFNAFGFVERVLREAYWVNETTFWKPDDKCPTHIIRNSRIQDVEDGLSEFPHVILNQARVHDFYLDVMRNSPIRLEPKYYRQLVSLQVTPDSNSGTDNFPVTATIERTDPEHSGQLEIVKARYVIGCDGARSKVRQSIGRTLQGDSANQLWGVMDVLAVSDFPDVRMKSLIQSDNKGTVLIIPREGGYLIRLYIELGKLREGERVSDRQITSDDLISKAKEIFHPYAFDVREVAWWSVYEIGQRLCDRFDDVPEDELELRSPYVFIAGDACHTHSPKAGQGMNVSMRDTFNLGWKLAAVLQGRCSTNILHTYTAERQKVAKTLIDFDREWATIVGSQNKPCNEIVTQGATLGKVEQYFVKSGRYTAGTAIKYEPSAIIASSAHQSLASGFEVGTRFHSAPVIRLSDAKPVHIGHTVLADGRWRLFIFSDGSNPDESSSSIRKLCLFLAADSDSPIKKYTRNDADVDSVIDVRAIFQQEFRQLLINSMPEILLPKKGRYKLVDYEKVFCADRKNGPDVFDMRGIDRKLGCMVVVRPDQHIAHVLPINAYAELTAFFDAFMLRP